MSYTLYSLRYATHPKNWIKKEFKKKSGANLDYIIRDKEMGQ